MTHQDKRSGFMTWLQQQPQPVRVVIFIILIVAVVAAIFSLTAFLYYQNIANLTRTAAIAIREDLATVSEYAVLPDADAYPAALTVADDGTLYTASYVSGTVWAITADGAISELPGTREQVGSVSGLEAAPDGTLYILDHYAALTGGGAVIWRYADSTLTQVASLPASGERSAVLPNSIAADAAGNIYMIDLATRLLWRFAAGDDQGEIWWQAASEQVPAGLAYHALHNSLLLTEAAGNAIYEFSLDQEEAAPVLIYRYPENDDFPGFNGIDVAPDGRIFVAALDQNEVVELLPETGELHYLAGAFRGSSDVAVSADGSRVFVTNWDQRWLLPVEFIFVRFYVEPRLPFGIDAITLLAAD